MNLVLEESEEVYMRSGDREGLGLYIVCFMYFVMCFHGRLCPVFWLGRILLKGDTISLISQIQGSDGGSGGMSEEG